MAYKMKGFSGFKSPVKATDAGLVKAADKMSRGLEDPTSLVGEGVIGFLKGYAEAKKIKAKKDLTDAIKGDNAEINQKKSGDKDKKVKVKKVKVKKEKEKNPQGSTTGTLSPEEQEIFLEQYDPISNIEKSEAKTRRNKKNRRRNRERP